MAELSYTLLRLLPKNTLSRAVGAACRMNAPRPVMRAVIRAFACKYGGDITGYVNMPGQLWPVNPVGVRNVEKLFCVNERLTTFLKTARGACAVVAVGATNVGRIRAVYDDVVTNARRTRKQARKLYDQPVPVE